MIKTKFINIILAFAVLIMPFRAGYAFNWGESYSADSYRENYEQQYKSTNTQNNSWWSSFTTSIANTWTNVSTFVANTFNFIKDFTVNLASFVMNPISSIKDLFNKTEDIKAPPVENIEQSKSVVVEMSAPQLDIVADSSVNINYAELTEEQQNQLTKQAWELKVGDRESIDYKAILGDDARMLESTEGKLADVAVADVKVESISEIALEPVTAVKIDPNSLKNVQISMSSQNLAKEDMVSLETYKRRQIYINDKGQINYSGSIRSGHSKENEKLRFKAKGQDSIYEAKVFDNGNNTATVDMPLNWFSKGNVARVTLLNNSYDMKDFAGSLLTNFGVVNKTFNGAKAVFTANKRWERSIENGKDILANTVNSGKFQIVEVPGVNDEGIGPKELGNIKNMFNLADNQTLIIAHSAGTDLTARTLSQIDTTNREVFVLFLSPRMKHSTLKAYIKNSSIKFANVITANSRKDFFNWPESSNVTKLKTSYLNQKRWTHIYLDRDVTGDGEVELGHGSMYEGIFNGRKYTVKSNNARYNKKNYFLNDLYKGILKGRINEK